jgi:GNAT superfamily N-acetyltransferase
LIVLDKLGVVAESQAPVSFAVEHFRDVYDEARPLLAEHWVEIAIHKDIPLDPADDFYEKMDAAGALRIFTARVEGALVGYAVFVVRPRHAHYAIAWAMNDIVWVHPGYRNAGVGERFRNFWDAELLALGVVIVQIDTKIAHPALRFLLRRGGYDAIGYVMEKRLR